MSVRTDQVNLFVNVNSNKAQNELNDLRKKAGDVKAEMEGLKKGTAEYIAKKKELAEVTAEMDKLKQQIGLAALSQKELESELRKLKALRGSVVPFSEEFKQLSTQIEAVESRLYDVRNGVTGFSSFLHKLSDEIKLFGILAAAYLGLESLGNFLTTAIQKYAGLSDSLATVGKATGLSKKEVRALNDELGEIDTRTPAEQLRQIAIGLGQINEIASEENVAALDKIVVALGDEFDGDANQITNVLSVMRNNLQDIKTADYAEDVLKIGNALNVAGASGLATAPVVVDVTNRIAGMSQQFKLTSGQILGFASTFEEIGIPVEKGSTALVEVFQKIAQEPQKFAKVAGMGIKEFTNLVNTDMNAAFFKVAEGARKFGASNTEFAKILKELDSTGSGVSQVLSQFGANSEKVARQQQLMTGALQDSDSVMAEFNTQNTTFGATLAKLQKEFESIYTAPAVTGFLDSALNGVVSFVKALKDLPRFIADNRSYFLLLIGVVAAYSQAKIASALYTARFNILLAIETAGLKLSAVWTSISTTTSKAYALVKGVLTGQITLAAAAQRVWNVAVRQNPIVWAIAGLTALAIAISELTKKVSEETAAERTRNEIRKRAVDSYAQEESKVQSLTAIIKNHALSLDARKKALQDLIAINPKYLSGLTLENIETAKGKKLVDDYVASLRTAAELKAGEDLLGEQAAIKVKAKIDFENTVADIKEKYKDKATQDQVIRINRNGYNAVVNNAEKQIALIQKTVAETYQKKVSTSKDTPPTNEPPTTTEKLDFDKKEKKKKGGTDYDQLKKEVQAFNKELLKLAQEGELAALAEDAREMKRVELKYKELSARALDYYNKLLKDPKLNGEDKLKLKQQLDSQELTIEQQHQQEMKRLLQKFFDERSSEEYEQSLENSTAFFQEQAQQTKKSYAAGQIDKKHYEAAIREIERRELANRVVIAQDYSTTVKKAAEDVTKFKKAQEQQTTADLLEETEKRVAFEQKEQEARLQRLIRSKSNKDGSDTDASAEARKRLLATRFIAEVAGLSAESEQYKNAYEQLQKDIEDIDDQSWKRRVEKVMEYVGYFQQAMDGINQILANNEARQLAREKKKTEKDKKSLKEQFDNKLISQAQYDKKVQAMDEELERKEKAMARRQAERDKALNLFNAIISTASAVAKALPNIPLSIAAGILGGIQIASIASAPLPELGTGDWVREGDKHSDPSGGIKVMIERDEAVINAKTMTDKNMYTVTGTPAQITSALNKQGGGVDWSGGAVLKQMPLWRSSPQPTINSNMPRIMGQGGVVRQMAQVANQNTGNSQEFAELKAEMQGFREDVKNWNTTLKVINVLKEQDDVRKLFNDSKKAAGLSQ